MLLPYAAYKVSLFSPLGLQFAVQQQAGGTESAAIAEWMVGVTEQYFYENGEWLINSASIE